MIYSILDRLFDPPPEELRKSGDKAGIMLYYKSQDEGYKRYKRLCYRNLILESLLSFCLGLVLLALLEILQRL